MDVYLLYTVAIYNSCKGVLLLSEWNFLSIVYSCYIQHIGMAGSLSDWRPPFYCIQLLYTAHVDMAHFLSEWRPLSIVCSCHVQQVQLKWTWQALPQHGCIYCTQQLYTTHKERALYRNGGLHYCIQLRCTTHMEVASYHNGCLSLLYTVVHSCYLQLI